MLADGTAFAAAIVADENGNVSTVAQVGHKPVTNPATLFEPAPRSGELDGRGGSERNR